MVQKLINSLDIRYVANTNEAVPTGQQHIFEVTSKEGTLAIYSYCGVTKHEIGDKAVELKIRRSELPMCSVCAQKWKEDPRSPWAAWQKGVPIR
jgi:hypothetical protein